MLKIHFPFTIDNKPSSIEVKTHIERKENIISFSLEYKIAVRIEKSTCLSVQKHNDSFVYVFEFKDINDAMDFENTKECFVDNSTTFSDPLEIENEIVNYAQVYMNQSGNKKVKKKLVEDENGFKKYI
ncbi:hypothetical protein P3W45_000624 [Vairimorpha bombi]|jgi:hypothetical protein